MEYKHLRFKHELMTEMMLLSSSRFGFEFVSKKQDCNYSLNTMLKYIFFGETDVIAVIYALHSIHHQTDLNIKFLHMHSTYFYYLWPGDY